MSTTVRQLGVSPILQKAMNAQAEIAKSLDPEGPGVTIETGRAWRDLADLIVWLVEREERR